MHDLLQPGAPPSPRLDDLFVEPLGKDPTRAVIPTASEVTDLKPGLYPETMRRKIAEAPFIATMDLARPATTHRTNRGWTL
ncbi:MAG: hypothetical protein WDN69_17160 [Aliidongia sp.]